MIEILKDFPDGILALVCKGHVTKLDYQTILMPAVEKALEEHRKMRIYYEIGSEFTGIDPGAEIGRASCRARV